MIEPILNDSIHEKQLAPHLRKRLRGLEIATSYVQSIERESLYFTGIAGEPLLADRFGHFNIADGKIYYADVTNNRPADCFVITDAGTDEEVRYVMNNLEVATTEDVGDDVYLHTQGNITNILPTANFVQIVGKGTGISLFMLAIDIPKFYE